MVTPSRNGTAAPEVLWDMLDGPMPRGMLGNGDPDVHLIDGRWTMFLGGFSTSFRNRLYRATLADGAELSSGRWHVDRDRRGRVAALVPDPPRGAWDAGGRHTPNYVPAVDGVGPRIYYAGRATSRHYGPTSRYSIGVLEFRDGRWQRRSEPVLEGAAPRSSVLEPLVIHTEGRYRMWFQTSPHVIGPGEQPDYELRCSDSEDGLTGWSTPQVFASAHEGFFNNTVARFGRGWVMVLARSSNLHAAADFPAQGLWCITADHPSPARADWSSPHRLLDTDAPGTPSWLARGTHGPALALADPTSTEATVHFSATRSSPPWRVLASRRLAGLRRPPVPAPFYFATGRMQIDLGTLSVR